MNSPTSMCSEFPHSFPLRRNVHPVVRTRRLRADRIAAAFEARHVACCVWCELRSHRRDLKSMRYGMRQFPGVYGGFLDTIPFGAGSKLGDRGAAQTNQTL